VKNTCKGGEHQQGQKFEMSFDNVLIFTGRFTNSPPRHNICNTLYIPLTEKHEALTFKIIGQSFSNLDESIALRIQFSAKEEREAIANCDFLNDIFFNQKISLRVMLQYFCT